MKVKAKFLKKEDKIKYLDALYTASSVLKARDDVKKFLRDLLTESERIMIGRRILIASKLLKNQTYDDIVLEMKVGKDTIGKIHRWLRDEIKGYEKAIGEYEKTVKKREEKYLKKQKEIHDYYTKPFARIKRKYPLYSLLSKLVDKLNE